VAVSDQFNLLPHTDYSIDYSTFYYFTDGTKQKIRIEHSFGADTIVPPNEGDPIRSMHSISEGGDILFRTASNKIYYHRIIQGDQNRNVLVPLDPQTKIYWVIDQPYFAVGGTIYTLVTPTNGPLHSATDDTPPATSIDAVDRQWMSKSTFTITATDDSSGVRDSYWELYNKNTGISTFGQGTKISVPRDGLYGLSYTSRDWFLNRQTKSITLWVDTTAPVTKYTTKPVYGNDKPAPYIKGYAVTLIAVDNLSGVKQTFYRVNNGAWTLYSGSFELSGSGNMNLEFYSIDIAGNKEVLS
jgi:hypothetical protein